MSRKLASIQKISKVEKHPNADRLEIATINDWKAVVEKDIHKEDDIVVYIEVDSLCPVTNPSFEFLAKGTKAKNTIIDGEEKVSYGYRLKTIKLRGQISQGLAIPVNELLIKTVKGKDILPYSPGWGKEMIVDFDETDIDKDVSEVLKIVKYEQPIPAHLSGEVKGAFPSFIPKTDEERAQNFGEVIDKLQGEVFYYTEKLDGASVTIYKKGGGIGVCSRNLELFDTPKNTIWEIARKYDLANNLTEGYAIQGEIIGEGIQKNPLKESKQELYVYSVYNINEHRYLDFEEFKEFIIKHGLKRVPIIEDSYILNTDVDGLLKLAEGESMLNKNAIREGIVFRPLKEKDVEIDGVLSRLSFKAISNQYLLKNE